MAFGMTRDPNANMNVSASSYPISRTLGLSVLIALAILVLLRHLFGSLDVKVGAR